MSWFTVSRRGTIAALIALLLLGACSHLPSPEVPSALQVSVSDDPATNAYRRKLGALVANAHSDRPEASRTLPPVTEAGQMALARNGGPAPTPATTLASSRGSMPDANGTSVLRLGSRSFQDAWRTSRQRVYLAPLGGQTGSAPFTFSTMQARTVDIELVATQNRTARIRMQCDGPVRLTVGAGRSHFPAGRVFETTLGESGENQVALLHLEEGLRRCDGTAFFADGSRPFTLLEEDRSSREALALDARFDVCGNWQGGDALERTFFADSWLSQTCATDLGRIRLLPGEVESFDAKVEALLGRRLPPGFLEAGNPEAPLDFSRAPKLSFVYVSYLDIKADFSGRVMERLIRYHAARGTIVRVVTSEALLHGKDRDLLEGLAADHHNVQLKAFRWRPRRGAPVDELLASLHRVHHTKLLATLAREPGRSRAILGGRNIHDGFLFDEPLDMSGHPDLHQYGRKGAVSLNYYSNWTDIDVVLNHEPTVRTLVAHLSTLWHDDADSFVARPFSISGGPVAPPKGAVGRHFISVPYAGGRALERYFVDLFDAARSSIEIVSPYLNFTPPLIDAVERARERGISITIIGRVNMDGDLGGAALTALNRLFVERYADRFPIYDHQGEGRLLHSKMLLIDRRLVVLSSVNFNNRSFIHDNENGIAVLSERFYRQAREVFEEYRANSVLVGAQPIAPYWRLFFASRLVREAM